MSIRIIHPYGSSTVVRINEDDSNLQRKLLRKGSKEEDVGNFATAEPELLVAQWMAVLDKVLRKPNPKKKEKLPEVVGELRQALGSACWERLQKKLPKDEREECKAIWKWRLEALEPKDGNNDDDNKISKDNRKKGGNERKGEKTDDVLKILEQGKLFEGFLGEERLRQWMNGEKEARQRIIEEVADRIERHLHDAALKTDGTERPGAKPLIEHRASSISRNVPGSTPPQGPSWLAKEEEIITALRGNDFAARIHEANARMKCKEKRRLYPAEAGEIISSAYGKQFGKGKSRKELKEKDPALLAFFDDARACYKRLFRSPHKRTLSHVLPRNIEALAHRLKQQHANRRANALIRIGRVMHYEVMNAGGEEKHYGKILQDGVDKSRSWTSDGQHEIKRTEAFVRVWRNVISQAGLVLKAWVDPQGKAPGDIVGMERNFEDALQARPSSPPIEEHAHLLFGQRAEEMLKELAATEILEKLASMLRNLRHGSLHFSSRQQFIARVREKAKVDKNALKAFSYLLQEDFKQRSARLKAVCEGALLHQFTDDEQLEGFLKLLWGASAGQDIVLPRFRRVMQRLRDVGLLKMEDEQYLPGAPSATEMEQDPWLRARYIGLKLAYEKPFRAWLAQLSAKELRGFIEQAADRATREARKLNKRQNHPEEVIVSRARRLLDRLPEDADLATFIARLTAESASEYRIHDGYRGNPEKARNLAGWVDKLHCEVMGRAFRAFCKEHGHVHWLLEEARKEPEEKTFPDISPPAPSDQFEEDWRAGLYALLHLVPVQEAARLLHQLRKWRILEGKQSATGDANGQEKDVSAMLELLELYLDMHDAKFTGGDMDKQLLQPFHAFYKGGKEDFEKVFFGGGEHDERLLGMRRDLREILRFGHLPLIRQIMGSGRISRGNVEALQEQDIAQKQKRRMKLHERWEKKKKLSDKQRKEYGKLVREIQNHRQLRACVCLQNAARAQRLLVRIAARLADYAGLWERDLYFITLALARQHGAPSLRELFRNKRARKDFHEQRKVRIKALRQDVRDALHQTFTTGHDSTRNALAHFDILRDRPLCITRHVNNARAMLAHDRKLKNAVSKSIIDLLWEEGLTLEWNTRGHELHAVRVRSRQITHLGDRKIREYLHGRDYADMIASMFGKVRDTGRKK